MKRDSSLRRFTHPGHEKIKPEGCYTQGILAFARNCNEVRCGSVVQERTSANPLECGLAKA